MLTARPGRRRPSSPLPWEVRHVDVRNGGALLEPVAAGTGGAYVVLWDGDVPLGALCLSGRDVPLTVEEALERLPSVAKRPCSTPDERRLAAACTVVVCTRGRSAVLRRCLDALVALDPAPAAVLVVDNGPSDPCVEALVASCPGASCVSEPRLGLSYARNTGWRAAGTPLVAYTDDDVVVHRAWLGALLAGFDEPEVMSVTGLVLPASLETPAQQAFERYWTFNKGFTPRTFGREFYAAHRSRGVPVWQVGAGASMALRRDYLKRTGGFDERLGAGASGCSEDSELWFRILADGLSCRYEPSAVVFHEHRREPSELQAQLRAYMRGHVVALLVQYARYGEPGELRRVCVGLPAHFVRLAVRRLRCQEAAGRTQTLRSEVLGALGGLVYAVREPSLRSAVAHRLIGRAE